MQNKVLILDFGSQYTQLIARRVRELSIFCEIHPFHSIPEEIETFKAVILSGSPYSVRAEDAPHPDLSAIRTKIPLLGVCYGAQYLAHFNGGEVAPSNTREYGRARLTKVETHPFLHQIPLNSQVWMSHSDTIKKLPDHATQLASTKDVANAAYVMDNDMTFGIQFHPEVYHSTDGKQLLQNFLVDIAGITPDWTSDAFVDTTVANLKEQL
ncbi:MAG: glutamine-hydrolyzing GMP synthase, partial [Flavobacteriaceae bacterium]